MTHYIIGFVIYTLGTIGVLFIGYIMVKHFLNVNPIKVNKTQKKFLKLEQGISLEPRKSVYILKAGKQRFLIATTPDKVCFLSELDKDNIQTVDPNETIDSVQMHPELESKLKYINFVKDTLKI